MKELVISLITQDGSTQVSQEARGCLLTAITGQEA